MGSVIKSPIISFSSSRHNTTTERITIQKTSHTECTDKSFAIGSIGGPFEWWNSTASTQLFHRGCWCQTRDGKFGRNDERFAYNASEWVWVLEWLRIPNVACVVCTWCMWWVFFYKEFCRLRASHFTGVNYVVFFLIIYKTIYMKKCMSERFKFIRTIGDCFSF